MRKKYLIITGILLLFMMIIPVLGAQASDTKTLTPVTLQAKVTLVPTIKGPLVTTLYVNSRAGDDTSGTGSSPNPFKTITHAMDVARSGTTIMAEGGMTYGTASGEVFPIQMKEGVTLTKKTVTGSGSVTPVNPNPIIKGGARYDIPDSPLGRYVSVLGADDATISGFSFQVINTPGTTQDDGTAIMCDYTSPTITNNQFSGKAHAGITTLGDAHPDIVDNSFTGELTWGITTYGDSYPTVSDNSFSCDDGIDCSGDSYPTIEGNSFSCGSAGISTKSASHPFIIDNDVKGNGDFGIIVRMDSTPVIQGNRIKQNPYGIYTQPGEGALPDIGGGGESSGDNVFDNYDWNIYHRGYADISARSNQWGSACCEDIEAKIYDKEDDALSGSVDFGTCIICTVRGYALPVTPSG